MREWLGKGEIQEGIRTQNDRTCRLSYCMTGTRKRDVSRVTVCLMGGGAMY
jgi:hypothetical protein